ncbi:MAG: phenylalanine--tRNA ligase subunit beta [Candidatus Eremiobacteraeota bacterium]|nr:phenylalanine--tRNA ligase subunit beta [Candidatus Eremiobacteraeota bacterium]
MRVPIAWLREYLELPNDSQKIADTLANLGFPVETIEKRPAISGVVIGRIAELGKHPNADRLQVGRIDIGSGSPLTIATAATNVAAGQTIAVAMIGAQLPALKIERRTMRGVESAGMMISADELALPNEWFEDGIMQFDAGSPLGSNVVEVFGLADDVLDVEVTSNRPDMLSILGIARELAAAFGVALRAPSFENPGGANDGGDAPRVTLESVDCTRFVAQRFSNVRAGIAPARMRIRLALAGQRPINSIVDISNYVMLETGQPLHFYDDAKIPHHHLIVRDATEGESLVTLDGTKHTLSPADLVVASDSGAQGLAGLKGGKESEISNGTTALLLESANFYGPRIRRMSSAHGFRTDASGRHEKGLALALTDYGAARAAALLVESGATAFEPHVFGEPASATAPISFPIRDVKRLLGFELTVEEVRELLDRLGFAVSQIHDGRLEISAPPWRRDVTIGADVVEEIARCAGYDRLEAVMPLIPAHEIPSDTYRLERKIAHALASLGYRELSTLALHGASVFEKIRRAGLEPRSTSVEIRNPLSEDQRYLRYELGPALLDYAARMDVPAKFFEIGHVFTLDERQPSESSTVAFANVVLPVDEPPWKDSAFLRIKGDCQALLHDITGRSDFEVVEDRRNASHPGKAASVLIDGREVAELGRIDPRLERSFGSRLPVYFCSIYVDNIPDLRVPKYVPPSKYPSTYRDLALICSLETSAAQIERTIAKSVGELGRGTRVFDEYRGPQVGDERKSLAVRMTLQRDDATITDGEADAAVAAALSALRADLGVRLRGE